jgi:hypothetical protein
LGQVSGCIINRYNDIDHDNFRALYRIYPYQVIPGSKADRVSHLRGDSDRKWGFRANKLSAT